MKVLIIGSGGKIACLVRKLAQSKRVTAIYCTYAPAGLSKLAEIIDIRENETDKLYNFVKENTIDLTIIESLTAAYSGVADKLRKEGYNVFGAGKNSCNIQFSRGFAKKFMYKYKIPTPAFGVFDKETQAIAHARKSSYPQVVKFDSRIPGTGTIICNTFNEAKNAISFCLKNSYKPVVLENFVSGREVSFHVFTDGYNAVPLPASYVYKKSEDGNLGFSTPGMGAYSPVSYINEELEAKIGERIFFPLIDGLNAENSGFAGTLKATIIIDEKNNLHLTGVNVELGDPEAQAILPLINDDIFEVMFASSIGALGDNYEVLDIKPASSVCVTMAAEGFPGEYKKNAVIEGIEEIDDDNTFVFYAGVKKNIYAELVTEGGRVLNIVSTASTLSRARELVYESVSLVRFQGKKYRKDIARDKVLNSIKD